MPHLMRPQTVRVALSACTFYSNTFESSRQRQVWRKARKNLNSSEFALSLRCGQVLQPLDNVPDRGVLLIGAWIVWVLFCLLERHASLPN